MGFAKSKAKLFLDNRPKVTFDDVAGCDESKEELEEVVQFLKDPAKFTKLGARVPRGVLLLALPVPVRRSSLEPSRARPTFPSSASAAPTSSRCSSASGAARVRDLFEQGAQISTLHNIHRGRNRTRWDATAEPASAADTTSASRR